MYVLLSVTLDRRYGVDGTAVIVDNHDEAKASIHSGVGMMIRVKDILAKANKALPQCKVDFVAPGWAAAMEAGASLQTLALIASLDWDGVTSICDVGGGTGATSHLLLQHLRLVKKKRGKFTRSEKLG